MMLKYLSILLLFISVPLDSTLNVDCASCGKQDAPYLCAQNTLAMNTRLCMDISEVPGMLRKAFLIDMKEEHVSGSEEYQSNFPDFK